jgi:hypothetical protein
MNPEESFSTSIYADAMHRAEGELSAFIRAVTELSGPEQARLAAEDWLEEAELMDSPPRCNGRDWRAVTVAASARLANRLDVGRHHRTSPGTSTAETKVLPRPSCNCFPSTLQV